MALQPISRSVDIAAPASDVFALLTNPHQHPVLDGSGTVKGCVTGDVPLELGSSFVMKMNLKGTRYRTVNTVVEFDDGRKIAWEVQPKSRVSKLLFGGHRWRFEVEPTSDGCRVTETWDPSTFSKPTIGIKALRFETDNVSGIEDTLARLKDAVEAS